MDEDQLKVAKSLIVQPSWPSQPNLIFLNWHMGNYASSLGFPCLKRLLFQSFCEFRTQLTDVQCSYEKRLCGQENQFIKVVLESIQV